MATPWKRAVKLSEVANVIEFLASEKSSWVTGQILTVDGGFNRALNMQAIDQAFS